MKAQTAVDGQSSCTRNSEHRALKLILANRVFSTENARAHGQYGKRLLGHNCIDDRRVTRFERTPARSRARTEKRIMDKTAVMAIDPGRRKGRQR